MKHFAFGKQDRLLKRAEFLHLADYGIRIQNRHFIIVFHPNDHGKTRLGVTVTKKVGNAVKRNKIKRALREFFRMNRCHLKGHWDINIIAKFSAANLDAGRTQECLNRLFQRLSEYAPSH